MRTLLPKGLRKITVSGVMILLGTLAVMLAGCNANNTGQVLDDAHQIFRFPINANGIDIKTLDPARAQDFYSYYPIYLTFPGLMTLDSSGTPQPWAAASAPSYDQAKNTYTFTVRSGLKWSDGTPIDANTFAYSINRALNPCIGSAVTYYLFPIKDAAAFSTEKCGADGKSITGKIPTLIGDSLNVTDNQTLVITLAAPAPYFLQALCYPTAFAQPKQLIDQFGEKDWTQHLTDNGGFGGNLYKVKVWDHKGNLDLVRNTAFWGTAPKLREVDFKIYKTVDAEYADYLTGRLDQGAAPPAQYTNSKKRSDFHEVPYLAIGYYQPVWTKAPFDNELVRQAFDLAINKQVLADSVLHGSVTPTNHIVPQGMYGYDPGLTGPDGTTSLTGNVTKATQLMQQYATAKCGGQIANCPAVTLEDANDPSTELQDQAVIAMWNTAFPGLKITTHFTDFGSLINDIYGSNPPQIFGIGWTADYPDPQDWLSLQFGTGSLNNTGFVNVPAANALMTQADQNLDPASRSQEYNQAEQLEVTAGAWIPLYQQKTFYNLPTYVHNFMFSSLGVPPLATWQQIYLTSH